MVTPEQTIDLSLEELSNEVALLLEEYNLLGATQDHRVSPTPDVRTIRYYTTLGILDRPQIAGRQARYGKRQLLQLLAIKALQAVNLPLAEVQGRLYGKSNDELEELLAGLASAQRPIKETPRPDNYPVLWKEISIEPGLKVMVQQGWTQDGDLAALTERISQALRLIT